MSIKYTEIFKAVKIENSIEKMFDTFSICGQNIDCRYKIEVDRTG